jgi:hypothetical protein
MQIKRGAPEETGGGLTDLADLRLFMNLYHHCQENCWVRKQILLARAGCQSCFGCHPEQNGVERRISVRQFVRSFALLRMTK